MSTLACETVVKQTTSTPVGVDDALSDDGSEYYDFDPSTFGVNDGIPQGDPSDLMGLSEGMKISSNTDTSNPVPKTKEYQPLSAILQPKENFSRSPLPSLPNEPSEKTDSDVPIPSLQSCISVSNSMSTHPVLTHGFTSWKGRFRIQRITPPASSVKPLPQFKSIRKASARTRLLSFLLEWFREEFAPLS